MLRRSISIFQVVILLSSIFVLTLNSSANPAQSSMFVFGYNLGKFEARINAYSRIGFFPESVTQRNFQNMFNALQGFENAERLREPIFNTPELNPERKSRAVTDEDIRNMRIYRQIYNFFENTRGMNGRQQTAYIRNIVQNYKQKVGLTHVSSREDEFQPKPNCDSKMIDVGYHLGRAAGTAEVPFQNRRRADSDRYQQQAFAAMRNVIFAGLRISVDGFAPGRASDNVEKICCSFGSRRGWNDLLKDRRWNMSANDYESSFYHFYRFIQGNELIPGSCGGEPPHRRNAWAHYYGWWYLRTNEGSTICKLNLTDRQSRNPAGFYLIEGCSQRFYWKPNNDPSGVSFYDNRGKLTNLFVQKTEVYLQGSFIPLNGRRVQTYLKRASETPPGENCRWEDPTTTQASNNCQCYCNGVKVSDNRCKTPKPRFPNFCLGTKKRPE